MPSSLPVQRPGEEFPAILELPDGFRPESVAVGAAPIAYFGSLADGSIHQVDLATGAGRALRPGTGTTAGGLQLDARGRLFVAGGFGGDARVIDTATGDLLAEYRLAPDDDEPTLVADVVLTADAAWFTDSFVPVLYRMPFGPGGRLPPPTGIRRIPLTGDIVYRDGFNASGITRTPDGTGLLVMQANSGRLFRVDTATGATAAVVLTGRPLTGGDGMMLSGTTLYAALGLDNALAVLRLNSCGTVGHITERRTHPAFDVPTAVAAHGDRLYVVNSRLGTPPPAPDGPYSAVAIPR